MPILAPQRGLIFYHRAEIAHTVAAVSNKKKKKGKEKKKRKITGRDARLNSVFDVLAIIHEKT